MILCSAKRYVGVHWRIWWKRKYPHQNWKEAFRETAFPCVNSTPRVTRFSSVFSLLTQLSGNLPWDTSERNEACGEKGNVLRWNLWRSYRRNFLVMCEFISQSYPFVLCYSPLSLFLRNLRRTSLDRFEAYADKEISSVANVEEAFWETSLWSVNSSLWVTA